MKSLKEQYIDQVIYEMRRSASPEDLYRLNMVLWEKLDRIDFKSTVTALVVAEPNDEEFISRFLAEKTIAGLSPKTLRYYKSTIRTFYKQMGISLDQVGTEHIKIWLAQRLQETSRRNADSIRRILSSFYHWMEEEGYVKENPMKRVKRIRVEKTLEEPFTDIELEKIRAACETVRERTVIEVLLSTACRAGEVQGMKLSDMDLANGRLTVWGKGKKERVVYINASARLWIERYLAERHDQVDRLFVSSIRPARELSATQIGKMVRTIGERAGVVNVHPHRFRRTAATIAIHRGMPIEHVQRILGHSDLDTTLIYAKVNKEDVKRTHAKVLGG